ncbi:MAG: O-antigen ligase family protein [Ignavibacteriae bacterium]|nr:O-antigen ligase family protein [Ignavibacteria bacterium]MBI3364072.1 O-antigen ligase family protein [Ignavibacteriota bacterium]
MTVPLISDAFRFTRLRLLIYFFTVLAAAGVTFSVAISSIAMGTAIVLWVVFLVATKGSSFPRTKLDMLFIAYAAAELLVAVFSQETVNSLVNAKRLFLISFVYLVLTSIDDQQKLKMSIVFFGGIAAILSFAELFSLTEAGGHFLRVSLFQYFLTEGGIKMIALLLLIPFVLHQGTPRKWKVFAMIGCVPLLIGLILTQTRSSWLGFIAGVITIGIVKSKKILIALLLLIILFLAFAPTDFRTRAASIFDPMMTSNLTRIHMIATGWRMFLDRPLTGFGDVDLRKYYITYIVPIDTAEGGHLHNNIMMLLVTLGIFGFAAITAIFVKIFLLEREAVRATSTKWLEGSVAVGCLAAYISFHINGLFEWNFGDHEIAVLLWFTVGLALVSQRLAGTKSAEVQ